VQILGGVVVIESLFALPGLGRLLLTSIQNRDLPIVQGGLLLIVMVALAVNLVVDILYQVVDPRMRR
jgi:peptide/nickel transport system permease protein